LNGEKLNHSREIDRICQNLGIEKTQQWLWAVIGVRAYYFIAQVLSSLIISKQC
jgi:hypothetical protein